MDDHPGVTDTFDKLTIRKEFFKIKKLKSLPFLLKNISEKKAVKVLETSIFCIFW